MYISAAAVRGADLQYFQHEYPTFRTHAEGLNSYDQIPNTQHQPYQALTVLTLYLLVFLTVFQ